MKSLKSLNEWSYKTFSDRFVIRKELEQFLLPKLEICIDNSLGFTVKMFGSFLVDDHELYLKYHRSMQNVTLSMLVKELEAYTVCDGVNPSEMTSKLYHHVVPLNPDLDLDDNEQFHARDIGERRTVCLFVITLYVNLVKNTYCLQVVVERPRNDGSQDLLMLMLQYLRLTQRESNSLCRGND